MIISRFYDRARSVAALTFNIEWAVKAKCFSKDGNQRAVSMFYCEQSAQSVHCFVNELLNGRCNELVLRNLGYIVSKIDFEYEWEYLLAALKPYLKDAGTIGILATKLYAEILLIVSDSSATSFILTSYIKRYFSGRSAKRGIYYIHIPKCGGTSLCEILGHHFYGSNYGLILPSYTEKRLLSYCLTSDKYVFPFLSSQHTDINEIAINRDDFFTACTLRRPIDRLKSMYRQSMNSLLTGYSLNVIPKYGSHWKYWKVKDVKSFLREVDPVDLQRQFSTFSRVMDMRYASKVLSNVNQLINLKQLSSGKGRLEFSGIAVDFSEIPRDRNSSPKTFPINFEEEEMIMLALEDEVQFLRGLDFDLA